MDKVGQHIVRKCGAFVVKITDFFRQSKVQILILLEEKNESAKGYVHAFSSL